VENPGDPTALQRALAHRGALLARLHGEDTTCYRLFHGATEGFPGLAADRYGAIFLLQSWGERPPDDLAARWAALASEAVGASLTPVWNHRGSPPFRPPVVLPPQLRGTEAGLSLDVQPRHRGADPLVFLDFRAGRRILRARCAGASVLNLFAYTGTAGLAAAAGGATDVWNVDFARSALAVADANAAANGLAMRQVHGDAFAVMRQLAGLKVDIRRRRDFPRFEPREFDVVVLDPPTWATSPFGTVDLVRDYPSVFKPALLATRPGGHLLVTNHVATVEAADWHDVLRRAATKAGRPVQALEPILPEEDFPSPDGRHPLKMAWLEV
jgi:23S rRNA (cytosine1962-C5)-methyltransferase